MKRLYLFMMLAVALFFAADISAAESEPAYEYAMVRYPLKLNYTAEAGTIEVWVKPYEDLEAPADDFYHFFIFRLIFGKTLAGEQGSFAVIWKHPLTLYPYGGRADERIQNVPMPRRNSVNWQKGKWHHFAFTWDGPTLAIYADGKLLQKSRATSKLPMADEGLITLGFGNSEIAVDEFCLSSRARSDKEIAQRAKEPIVEDEYTLILDHFDESAAVAARTIDVPRRTEVVEGRFGQGLKLFKQK